MNYFLNVLEQIEDRNSSGRFPVELLWDPADNLELSVSQVLSKLVEFVKPKSKDQDDSSLAVDEKVSGPSEEDQQELGAPLV